jgi:hypothetical protein
LEALKDIIMKMMIEVLGVFAVLMKEMEQGRASESIPDDTYSVTDRDLEKYGKKFLKALIGRNDRVKAALSRMDELTDKKVAEAIAQIRSAVNRVEQGVEGARVEISGKLDQVIDGTFSMSGTHKCRLKLTSHMTSRQGKESS